tara:strand:- start:379 stop:531 length:153 start_codon:yes stop_codon:yes gene_type:complete
VNTICHLVRELRPETDQPGTKSMPMISPLQIDAKSALTGAGVSGKRPGNY